MYSGPTKSALRLLLSLTFAAAVFLAMAVLPAPAAEYHGETAAEHLSSDLHDKTPCDGGFVCSVDICTNRYRAACLIADYQILVILHDISFLHFKIPQVDLRPPRTAA